MARRVIWWGVLLALAVVSGSQSTCRGSGQCESPGCRCSDSGIPGGLDPDAVPQMIIFTFDSSVNSLVYNFYERLFSLDRRNPNGCPIKMTVFVPHVNTNYKMVKSLAARGMEIGAQGVAPSAPRSYWKDITYEKMYDEISQQLDNLEKEAGISREEIRGWRNPGLQPSGDIQYGLLQNFTFDYDSSLSITKRGLDAANIWPFTLDYGWDRQCHVKPCPRRRYPGLWEVPVVSLVDPVRPGPCGGSHVDSCTPFCKQAAVNLLWKNFLSHYQRDKAPFLVNMQALWFLRDRELLDAVDEFMKTLLTYDDVYFVTIHQALEWMRNPVSKSRVSEFAAWQCSSPVVRNDLLPRYLAPSIVEPPCDSPFIPPVLTMDLPPCRQESNCLEPTCRCSRTGPPSNIPVADIPQIVIVTYDGTVTGTSSKMYSKLFNSELKNPNGCPITMTMFVHDLETDYKLVKNWYLRRMEIGVHSVTVKSPSSYWATLTEKEMYFEIVGQRNLIVNKTGIPESEIRGWRSPFLQPSGDRQFKVLYENGFEYDSTLTMTKRTLDFINRWPFTMDYGWDVTCEIPPCPVLNYTGLWQVPIVSLVNVSSSKPCRGPYVDSCLTTDKQSAYNLLLSNFESHYNRRRAPFMINLQMSWLMVKYNFDAMKDFFSTILSRGDVYVMSIHQALAWMKNPTPLSTIGSFEQWQCSSHLPLVTSTTSTTTTTTTPIPTTTSTFAPTTTRSTTTAPNRRLITARPRTITTARATTRTSTDAVRSVTRAPTTRTTTTRALTTRTTTARAPTTRTTTTRAPTTRTTTTPAPTTKTTPAPFTTTTTRAPITTTTRSPVTTTTTTPAPTTRTTKTSAPTTTTTTRVPTTTTTTRAPTTTTSRAPITTTTTRAPTTTTTRTRAPITTTTSAPTTTITTPRPTTTTTSFASTTLPRVIPLSMNVSPTTLRTSPSEQEEKYHLTTKASPTYSTKWKVTLDTASLVTALPNSTAHSIGEILNRKQLYPWNMSRSSIFSSRLPTRQPSAQYPSQFYLGPTKLPNDKVSSVLRATHIYSGNFSVGKNSSQAGQPSDPNNTPQSGQHSDPNYPSNTGQPFDPNNTPQSGQHSDPNYPSNAGQSSDPNNLPPAGQSSDPKNSLKAGQPSDPKNPPPAGKPSDNNTTSKTGQSPASNNSPQAGQPSDRNNLAIPGQPSDPNNPSQGEQPFDPNNPLQGGQPSDPNYPSEDGQPSDPNNTTQGGQPSDPNYPSEDGQPSDPNNTTQGVQPFDPNYPPRDGQPSHLNNPPQGGQPSDPNNSSQTGLTSDPNNSPQTGLTSDPNNSPQTGRPSDPKNPSQAGQPSDPNQPFNANNQSHDGQPHNSTEAGQPFDPNNPLQGGQPSNQTSNSYNPPQNGQSSGNNSQSQVGQPADRNNPSQDRQPSDPNQPSNPNNLPKDDQPSDPNNHTQGGQSSDPINPSQGGQPSDLNKTPQGGQLFGPSKPRQDEQSTGPNSQSQAGQPSDPNQPSDPSSPPQRGQSSNSNRSYEAGKPSVSNNKSLENQPSDTSNSPQDKQVQDINQPSQTGKQSDTNTAPETNKRTDSSNTMSSARPSAESTLRPGDNPVLLERPSVVIQPSKGGCDHQTGRFDTFLMILSLSLVFALLVE